MAYAAFALSLVPGLAPVRIGYLLFGSLVPTTALWTVDRAFRRDDRHTGIVAQVGMASAVVVPVGLLGHLLFAESPEKYSLFSLALGVFVFGGFGVVIWRLVHAWQSTAVQVERRRRGYLVAVVALAAFATLGEQLGRTLQTPSSVNATTLHGPAPPLSAVLAGLTVFLLYHTVIWSRLLDLHEVFSRLARIVLLAIVLVLMDGFAVLWVEQTTGLHSAFQLFLVSALFLAAYDPIDPPVKWAANRVFNRGGQQLTNTLDELRGVLPAHTEPERLVEVLLSRLATSGRCSVSAVYLWDTNRDAFVVAGGRGHEDPPLQAVAAKPFTDPFVDGARWYSRPSLLRRSRPSSDPREILALMDAMQTDLVLPFVRSDTVLGWLALRDEAWSDGYSQDELGRLAVMAELAAVALANIRDFERQEEQHRLAALGEMAAGLAHEIRNPLAGVKGATQYLQDEDFEEDAAEMLQVIIVEVDRLDTVVSQFLDYARPFELHPDTQPLNVLVTHVLRLLRAEGVPPGIELCEELSGDLPAVTVDGTRLQQVLLNLLRNALQAMPHGGQLDVTTRRGPVAGGEATVELVVRDTGAGISPSVLEKLFVPFYTTKVDGTGLGLPICRRIVEAHRGSLEVRSLPEQGATFVVRLPVTPQDAPGARMAKDDASLRRVTSR
jgi:signal transduction histidine kinase